MFINYRIRKNPILLMSAQSLKLRSNQNLLAIKIKRTISEVPHYNFPAPSSKQQETISIQNGLEVDLNHHRQKKLTNILEVLLCLNTIMLFSYYELDSQKNSSADFWLVLTYIVHLFSCLLLFSLFIIQSDSLKRTAKTNSQRMKAITKIIIFLIVHPFPWINHVTMQISYDDAVFVNRETDFKVNYILLLVTIMKDIVTVLKTVMINSTYMTPRASRIKKLYSVNVVDTLYALRCIFRDQSMKMFFLIFALGNTFFSFAIKVTQSSIPVSNNPFQYYQNCIWYVLITTTTVGYGQIRLFSHLGYIINIFATIFGSICISGILFIISNTLSLNSKEMGGLTTLKSVNSEILYKKKCREYIRITIWRLWTNKKWAKSVRESNQQRKLRQQLWQIRKQGKTYNDTGNLAQFCQREFDSVLYNTQLLSSNNEQILRFINSHIFSEQLFRGYSSRAATSQSTENHLLIDRQYVELADKDLQKKKSREKRTRDSGTGNHIKIKVIREQLSSQSEISQYQPVSSVQ